MRAAASNLATFFIIVWIRFCHDGWTLAKHYWLDLGTWKETFFCHLSSSNFHVIPHPFRSWFLSLYFIEQKIFATIFWYLLLEVVRSAARDLKFQSVMSTILNNNKWATESAAWSSSHCSLSVSLRYTPMPNMWNRFCASSILSTFGMYILNSRHFERRRQSSVYLWSLWRISSDVSGKKSDCAQCLEIDKNVSFDNIFWLI